jgi:mRNA interferase RelE/StbE
LAWTLKATRSFERQLAKLDKSVSERIVDFLMTRVAGSENPRRLGTGLVGDLEGRWRYRVGDYRVICEIRDTELVVLAINVGHRKEIYQ